MENRAELKGKIAHFRRAHGFSNNEEHARIWMAQLGSFEVPLPNFHWRSSILDKHDSHHLFTGFDTSPKGEMQVASWELGAKVYDDWRQRALCRFLMLIGLITCPRAVLAAYRQGKSKIAGKPESAPAIKS